MSPCGSVAGCRLSGNAACHGSAGSGDPTLDGEYGAVHCHEQPGWSGWLGQRQSRQGRPRQMGPHGIPGAWQMMAEMNWKSPWLLKQG